MCKSERTATRKGSVNRRHNVRTSKKNKRSIENWFSFGIPNKRNIPLRVFNALDLFEKKKSLLKSKEEKKKKTFCFALRTIRFVQKGRNCIATRIEERESKIWCKSSVFRASELKYLSFAFNEFFRVCTQRYTVPFGRRNCAETWFVACVSVFFFFFLLCRAFITKKWSEPTTSNTIHNETRWLCRKNRQRIGLNKDFPHLCLT